MNVGQLLREQLQSVGIQGSILYHPVIAVANNNCGDYQTCVSADLNKVALSVVTPNEVVSWNILFCNHRNCRA